MQRPLRVLLTGGAGFLGGRIISELGELAAARGQEVHVRTLDLLPCETADHSVVGDITDASTVNEAARDIDGILHAAALIDWGNTPRSRLFEVNLGGTLRVLEAARKNGVRAVVYTSTMDVVMGGGPLVGIDEDHPYPDRYLDAYSESKALAEQAVLVNSVSVRSTRLADDLGYKPRFTPEEAFERVITYYAPGFMAR